MWLASPQAGSVFLFPPLTVALTLLFFLKTWTIFKVYAEFITTLLLFYALVFWPGGVWDLSSLARNRTRAPSLEGKV